MKQKVLSSLCLVVIALLLLPAIAGATTVILPKKIVFQDIKDSSRIKTFTGTMIYEKGSGMTYRVNGVIIFALFKAKDDQGNEYVILIDDHVRGQFSSGKGLTQVKDRLGPYAANRGLNLGNMATIVQQYYKHRDKIPTGKTGIAFHVF